MYVQDLPNFALQSWEHDNLEDFLYVKSVRKQITAASWHCHQGATFSQEYKNQRHQIHDFSCVCVDLLRFCDLS
jgi:hypothetical protein